MPASWPSLQNLAYMTKNIPLTDFEGQQQSQEVQTCFQCTEALAGIHWQSHTLQFLALHNQSSKVCY